MHYRKYHPTKAFCDKSKNSLIVHQENDTEHRYSGVRCGLAWPTPESPAYYCILAEKYVNNSFEYDQPRRGKLILLAEYQHDALNLSAFFQHMTDDYALLHCDKICANLEDFPSYTQLFLEFTDENKIRNGNMDQAPYADDFTLGLGLISDWKKNGLIELAPETIASQQIKSIASQHLADKPENKFFAVNGLRFAVGDFQKNKPTTRRQFRPIRR